MTHRAATTQLIRPNLTLGPQQYIRNTAASQSWEAEDTCAATCIYTHTKWCSCTVNSTSLEYGSPGTMVCLVCLRDACQPACKAGTGSEIWGHQQGWSTDSLTAHLWHSHCVRALLRALRFKSCIVNAAHIHLCLFVCTPAFVEQFVSGGEKKTTLWCEAHILHTHARTHSHPHAHRGLEPGIMGYICGCEWTAIYFFTHSSCLLIVGLKMECFCLMWVRIVCSPWRAPSWLLELIDPIQWAPQWASNYPRTSSSLFGPTAKPPPHRGWHGDCRGWNLRGGGHQKDSLSPALYQRGIEPHCFSSHPGGRNKEWEVCIWN